MTTTKMGSITRMGTGKAGLARIALGWMAGGFALSAALAGGMALQAQAIAGHNSNAPVSYGADRIELQDRQNRVILSGNVVINQANLQLTSARTLINYSDAGSLQINRITATGGVVVTRGDERASGQTAIYDFDRRIITMAGNVQLRRGSDTLSGGRLVIDLRSGVSSVDGSAAGGNDPGAAIPGVTGPGRVTGSFQVPQE
jgi:lipopolysaccharide export system protein LptA